MHPLNVSDIDLNLLNVFAAVHQTGSVSRAAERLKLSQPAASHALTRLRLLLHDPLFVGVLFAVLNLAAAPLSALVPRIVARIGRRPLFWAMPLSLCGSLLVMAWERDHAAARSGDRGDGRDRPQRLGQPGQRAR